MKQFKYLGFYDMGRTTTSTKEQCTISGVIVSSIKCTHLWNYGNIAVKDKPHPRVRECLKCKKFEYV